MVNYYYVSGSISKDSDYKDKFKHAVSFLRQKGYNIICPVEEGEKAYPNGATWEQYMKLSIRTICREDCVGLIMLPAWQASTGANIEKNTACSLNMKIYTYLAIPDTTWPFKSSIMAN